MDDGYYEAMSNSCVIFSQLVVRIIEASERCVDHLKYLKANLPKEFNVNQEKSECSTKQNSNASSVFQTVENGNDSSGFNTNASKNSQGGGDKPFTIFIKKEAAIPATSTTTTPPSTDMLNSVFEEALTHFKMVGNHKLYMCQKCPYEANDKNNFREHLMKHMNYKQKSARFKCRYCDYHGANSFFLKKHERELHKNSYTPRNVLNTKNIHHCSKCPFSARTRTLLNAHITHHQYKKNLFKCRYCDFYLDYKKKMSTHEVIHSEYEPLKSEDKFNKCNICPYKTLKLLR